MSSHSELRCPECRVLVDLKIDELPPNVLLMRILEGMKNVAHNQTNNCKAITSNDNKLLQQSAIQSTNQLSNASLPQLSHPTNPKLAINFALNRTNDESNMMRQIYQKHEVQQHQQQLQPQQLCNKQMLPNIGNSTSPPHAKALHDFISKESGYMSPFD